MFAPDFNNPWLFLPLLVWDLAWKGVGMWKAAHNNQRNWFVGMLLVNTAGILPIVYIKFFQKKQK